MPVLNKIQFRRGSAASWTGVVLSAGEIGFESDTGKFKIGDGITSWASLNYAAVLPSDLNELVQDIIGTNLVAGNNISVSYDDTSGNTTVAVTGVSLTGHTHTASNITDFNSSVSGLLPVKDVAAGSGIAVNNSGGTFTVSLSDPTIQLGDITDLTSNAKNFLLTPSSSNLSTLVSDETGSGSLVFGTGPTLSNATLSGTVTIGSDSLAEVIEDTIGSKVAAGSGVGVSYNDTTGVTTVSVSGVSLTGHTHVLADITDITASATEVNYLDGSVPGSGVASTALVLDSNKDIQGVRNLTLTGNLTVNGTTTTVNSTTITVDDKNLELGSVDSPSDTTADGGGLTLKGTDDILWQWVNSTQSWTSSEHINVNGASLTFKINGTTVMGNSIIGASGYALASGVTIDGGTP